jgi:two-component system LytT family sensor kinase
MRRRSLRPHDRPLHAYRHRVASAGIEPYPYRRAMDRNPRRLWVIIAAVCLVTAVLDGFQAYMQARIGREAVSWRAVIWQASEWLILGALTPITYYLARRFPLRRPRLARNVLVHLCGALVLCLAWAGAGVGLRLLLGTSWQGVPLSQQLASWMLISLPWSVFIYFAVLGSMQAFAYFVEARERETQAAQLAARLAEARLGALRMQLHPHFLFNSLNAITVLVRDQRTREATSMLELLSDVLRQVLRTDPSHEVALTEELRFLKQYLAIEQVRFSDRLTVMFAVDADVRDAAVPGFVLQPLVENALRHGLADRSEEGVVEIGARRDGGDLVLWVRDNGVGLPSGDAARGPGLGLANTRERLATLYGVRARLDLAASPGGGTTATIRLPYRRHG